MKYDEIDLGLFYWYRSGQWFVKNELLKNLSSEINIFEYLVKVAKDCISENATYTREYSFKAKSFLDAIDLFGENNIKNLVNIKQYNFENKKYDSKAHQFDLDELLDIQCRASEFAKNNTNKFYKRLYNNIYDSVRALYLEEKNCLGRN
jgi:hypothetical protein